MVLVDRRPNWLRSHSHAHSARVCHGLRDVEPSSERDGFPDLVPDAYLHAHADPDQDAHGDAYAHGQCDAHQDTNRLAYLDLGPEQHAPAADEHAATASKQHACRSDGYARRAHADGYKRPHCNQHSAGDPTRDRY